MKTDGLPKIQIPRSLGGDGLITLFVCGGPKLGSCTSPGCTAKATSKCQFKLLDGSGRTCNKPICGQHSAGGMCLPHARMMARPVMRP